MDLRHMINELYDYSKKEFGNENEAEEFIAELIKYAARMRGSKDIGTAIYDELKSTHATFVKKKKAA